MGKKQAIKRREREGRHEEAYIRNEVNEKKNTGLQATVKSRFPQVVLRPAGSEYLALHVARGATSRSG